MSSPISTDELETALGRFANDFTTSSKLKHGPNGEPITITYLDIPASFDIETTSAIIGGNKVGIPYTEQFAINGAPFLVREMSEFVQACRRISKFYSLDYNKRLIMYIHNAEFEFQFIEKYFNWVELFAIDRRRPVYMLTDLGIEFRCSYILSALSLEKVGEGLQKYHCAKLVGGLDYEKPRSPLTPLTDKELQYCIDDVKVVCAYIQEQIEQYGGVARLPLTNTGRVRKYCRDACFYNDGSHKSAESTKKRAAYQKLIGSLTIQPDEYRMLRQAFQGGFTHANFRHSAVIHTDVTSYDFCSSYPAVMVAEKFPMGWGVVEKVTSWPQFDELLEKYCCLFEIAIGHIEAKPDAPDHPSSSSKCDPDLLKNSHIDNGRLISADDVVMTITGEDWQTYKEFYNFSNVKIGKFIRYAKGYLPTEFVKCILQLYSDKTKLKGVDGAEEEYQRAKGMLNSLYGMTVTNIVRPEQVYDFAKREWGDEKEPELIAALQKYNLDKQRFLSYPWGVWVTAYARRNLFRGILECGQDYIYSDTDSIKILNASKHTDFIKSYNTEICIKLAKACEHHGIDLDYIHPVTVKGKPKPLGVWELDGQYEYFKTLGAKRYLTYHDGELDLTLAGCSSKKGAEYLYTKAKGDIKEAFDLFDDALTVPPEYSGRMVHTYVDEPRQGVLVDYLGTPYEFDVPTSLHLVKEQYSLKMSGDYKVLTNPNRWERIV